MRNSGLFVFHQQTHFRIPKLDYIRQSTAVNGEVEARSLTMRLKSRLRHGTQECEKNKIPTLIPVLSREIASLN